MKIPALLVFSMLTACAQDRAQRNWNISVAFFFGTHVMDTMSSRGAMEQNPVLGRGEFGGRQMAIKSGIAGGVILAEQLIMRKHPETRRFWTWANYGTGAAIAAVAVRNWNQPPYPQPAMASPLAKQGSSN
jgi:hypothetical protein